MNDIENDPRQADAKQGGPKPTPADGGAGGGRQPNGRGRGQTLDPVFVTQLQDATGAQKANARGYALNDPAQIGGRHLDLLRDERE